MEEEGRTWVIRCSEGKVRGGQRKWIASPEGRERRTQFHVCQHSRMTMVNRDVLPTLS